MTIRDLKFHLIVKYRLAYLQFGSSSPPFPRDGPSRTELDQRHFGQHIQVGLCEHEQDALFGNVEIHVAFQALHRFVLDHLMDK